MVASGALHLAGLCELIAHVTDENHVELLTAAQGMSKRRIELLIAERFPRPDVPATIRKLPAARPPIPAQVPSGGSPCEVPEPEGPRAGAPTPIFEARPGRAQRQVIEPLAPARYRLQLTVDQALHDKLAQARALLSHQVPDGDLAEVLDRALTALIEERMKKKLGRVGRARGSRRARAREGSRYVPSAVKREVFSRDGMRCTFVGPDGRRCSERRLVELDHIVPFARGGRHVAGNLRVRCRAHNQHAARLAGLLRPRRADSPRGELSLGSSLVRVATDPGPITEARRDTEAARSTFEKSR